MSSPAKQPTITIKPSTTPQEHYSRTVARIAKIQSHLTTAQRTYKLKGKVAIITGVASLKGIGYALSFDHNFLVIIYKAGDPLRSYLPMKVGGLAH
jgi:hypothetical protein